MLILPNKTMNQTKKGDAYRRGYMTSYDEARKELVVEIEKNKIDENSPQSFTNSILHEDTDVEVQVRAYNKAIDNVISFINKKV